MPVSPVLVDSSFYIRLLRQGQDPLRALALAAETRDLAVCGVVRCEVGRGLRDAAVLERFRNFWNFMINVPTDDRLWQEVESMLWQMDRKGAVVPLTDVVIACAARRINGVVLTFDDHFRSIPGVRSGNSLGV